MAQTEDLALIGTVHHCILYMYSNGIVNHFISLGAICPAESMRDNYKVHSKLATGATEMYLPPSMVQSKPQASLFHPTHEQLGAGNVRTPAGLRGKV